MMVSYPIFVQILLTVAYRLVVDGSPFIYTTRIRHIPCSLKKTNEIGICMFATECIQQKGTHLTTCIDGIIFGSCCKLPVSGANVTRPVNSSTKKPVTTTSRTSTTSSSSSSSSSSGSSTTTRRNVAVAETEDTTIIWVNTDELSIGTKPNVTSLVYVVDETTINNKTTDSIANISIDNVTNQSTTSGPESFEKSTLRPVVEISSLPQKTTIINEQLTTASVDVVSVASETPGPEPDLRPELVSSLRPLSNESTSTELNIDDVVSVTDDSSSNSSTVTSTISTLLSHTTDGLYEKINMSDYRDVCGRRFIRNKRIVGGKKSPYGYWPWQLSLMVYNRNENTFLHKCGAILVKETWAVTAAHCVQFDEPQNVLLRMGDYDLSNEDEPHSPKFVEVQIIALHQQFDRQTYEYDIALLRFKEPIQFQPNIVPICIPDSDDDFVGQTAFATGWGRLREAGPLPSIINEIELPVISNDECMSMYRRAGFSEYIPDIFICAGRKEGEKDSCEGDSGGPLALKRSDNRFLLAGIISWGIDCGKPNQPGVYVRVSYFREWINQIIQF